MKLMAGFGVSKEFEVRHDMATEKETRENLERKRGFVEFHD